VAEGAGCFSPGGLLVCVWRGEGETEGHLAEFHGWWVNLGWIEAMR
jgi:hypothetical protein